MYVICLYMPKKSWKDIQDILNSIFLWRAALRLVRLYRMTSACISYFHTKYHTLGVLKQQNFILTQFWRPEV